MTDSLDFGPHETGRPRETSGRPSLARQIICVDRELALRRRVYKGLVRAGKMKPETARLEIEGVEAVLATLQALREPNSKIS